MAAPHNPLAPDAWIVANNLRTPHAGMSLAGAWVDLPTVAKLYQNPTRCHDWGCSLSESRFPKLLKTLKDDETRESRWKGKFFAQGRCATRLRYAPTSNHLILDRRRDSLTSIGHCGFTSGDVVIGAMACSWGNGYA